MLGSRAIALLLLDMWDRYRIRYDVRLLGYVIMPNHLHIVLWSEKGESVKRFVEQTLRRSSGRIVELVAAAANTGDAQASAWLRLFRSHGGSGARAAVWKERGRAFPVLTGDALTQKLGYVHENPVRWGLVERAEDWEFSSASWYTEGRGPLAIDAVDGW